SPPCVKLRVDSGKSPVPSSSTLNSSSSSVCSSSDAFSSFTSLLFDASSFSLFAPGFCFPPSLSRYISLFSICSFFSLSLVFSFMPLHFHCSCLYSFLHRLYHGKFFFFQSVHYFRYHLFLFSFGIKTMQ